MQVPSNFGVDDFKDSTFKKTLGFCTSWSTVDTDEDLNLLSSDIIKLILLLINSAAHFFKSIKNPNTRD